MCATYLRQKIALPRVWGLGKNTFFRMVAATGLLSGVILIARPPILFGGEETHGYDALGKFK